MFAGIRFCHHAAAFNRVDLLVLDGKKVSSSLLRGAAALNWIMDRIS